MFTQAKPVETEGYQPGPKITSGFPSSRSMKSVHLTLNALAQESLFGRGIAGEQVDVAIGRGDDEGKLKLSVGTGPFTAKRGVNGSVRITMRFWDLLPKTHYPSGRCEYLKAVEGGVIIKLPNWTRPGFRDASAQRAALSAKK